MAKRVVLGMYSWQIRVPVSKKGGFERCKMESVFFASAPPRATTEVRAAAAAYGLATAPYAAAPPPNAHARATPRRTPADTANEETVAAGRAAPTVVRSR